MIVPLTARRKRLLHRSRYRSCKEADLLVGRFADCYLLAFDESALDRFEALIEEDDQDILAWITGRAGVPDRHRHDVFDLLKAFDITKDFNQPKPTTGSS